VKSLFPKSIESLFQPYLVERCKIILADINAFLEKEGSDSEDLVQFVDRGYLPRYLGFDKYKAPSFINLNIKDSRNRDMGLLMAFAACGGSLYYLGTSIAFAGSLDTNDLASTILNRSPQAFIADSELIPGAATNQLYNSLVQRIICYHSPSISNFMERNRERSTEHASAFFHLVSQAPVHRQKLDNYEWNIEAAHRRALDGPSSSFEPEAYNSLISFVLGGDDGGPYDPEDGTTLDGLNTDPLKVRMLDGLFYADAYRQLECSKDTEAILANLRLKAELLLEDAEISVTKDAVEQMLCCALCAHPDHFAAAGFGVKNLVGIEPQRSAIREIRNVLSGPLAVFTELTGTHDSIHCVVEYLSCLDPEFSPDAMVRLQGLDHERIKTVLSLSAGYLPSIEEGLLRADFPQHEISVIAGHVRAGDSFHRYSLTALKQLYFPLLYRAPLRQPDGSLKEIGSFIPSMHTSTFTRLYSQCPGFKDALIAHMETVSGWTYHHMVLTGLDYHSLPDLVKAMDLRDQGQCFANDLNL